LIKHKFNGTFFAYLYSDFEGFFVGYEISKFSNYLSNYCIEGPPHNTIGARKASLLDKEGYFGEG